MSSRVLVALLLCLLFLATTAEARSPWTRARGDGFAQAAFYAIAPYDRVITESGDEFETARTLTDLTMELYAEHGITDTWTVVAVVPFKHLDAGDPNPEISADTPPTEAGSLTALGNIRLGLRRSLARGTWNVAVQLDVEAPTAEFRTGTGLRSGYDAWSAVPVVSVGRGRDHSYWYAFAGGGWRGNGYSNFWRAGIEGGRSSGKGRWWWIGSLEILQTLHDGDRLDPTTNVATALYVDEQEVVAPVFKVLHRVSERWGLQGTLQGGFTGNFVARSPFVGLAVFAEY